MKRFENESFEEWRARHNLPRVRKEDKLAAQRAQYDAAPVIPAIAYEPSRDTAALTRLLKDRGGILYEALGYKGRYLCPIRYFADPVTYEEAKAELAGKTRRNPASDGRRKRFIRRMLQMYPGLDPEEAEEIAAHQFENWGVAISDLRLDTRVRLAVRAWLRHQDPTYARLLDSANGDLHGSPDYEDSRRQANDFAEDVMRRLR